MAWQRPMAWQHPELQEGEIFLANTDDEGFEEIGWETKRMGIMPYDVNNEPIWSRGSFFPVFVQKAEVETVSVST